MRPQRRPRLICSILPSRHRPCLSVSPYFLLVFFLCVCVFVLFCFILGGKGASHGSRQEAEPSVLTQLLNHGDDPFGDS